METAILVVWWVGLVVALLLTLVILKQVFVVVRVLRGILHLAERTRDAAAGVASNAAAVAQLEGLRPLLHPVPDALDEVTRGTQAVARRLDSLVGR